MSFQFRFAALQQYREHERDLCRQVLAQILAEEAALRQRKAALTEERNQALQGLGEVQQQNRIRIDEAAARRYYAAQLLAQIKQIDFQQHDVARRLELCRQTLMKADQGVKVLEKLAEQQRAEWLADSERRESREREEAWQSTHLRNPWD